MHLAAGAGGAIFVQCPVLSDICRDVLDANIQVPLVQDRRKIKIIGNRATHYGQSLATDPAHLLLKANYSLERAYTQLVPGQDSLDLRISLIDWTGQVVIGREYTCKLLLCPQTGLICDETVALAAVNYSTVDKNDGKCSIEISRLVCPMGYDMVVVQASLVSQATEPVELLAKCLSCRAGESRTQDIQQRVWWCSKCGLAQYVLDPNNPTFGCQVNSQG